MKLKHLFIFIFFFSLSSVYSQLVSTKGTDFWFAFLEQRLSNTYPAGDVITFKDTTVVLESDTTFFTRLTVFVTAEEGTTGTISIPKAGWSQNFTVSSNSTISIEVPVNLGMPRSSETIENKGIHLTSEKPVTVYALNFKYRTGDATLVLPTQTLGLEYRVLAFYPSWNWANYPSEFVIVASEDNTQLEIIPSVPTRSNRPANIPFYITLDAGEVYQVQNQISFQSLDLTGSIVRISGNECKPFSVLAGVTTTNIPANKPFGDHIYEQMFPTNTWGKQYITIPFKTRTAGDIIRILANEDSTRVDTNGVFCQQINAGEFIQFTSDTIPYYIESDKNVYVAQYSQGMTADGPWQHNADPFFITLSPIEQRIDYAVFNNFDSDVLDNYYINIFTKTGANDVELDGVNISSEFKPIPSKLDFSYAQLDVSVGNHIIESDSGVVVSVYGYGDHESYGYMAGASVEDLSIAFDVVFEGDTMFYKDFNTVCDKDIAITCIALPNENITKWRWKFGDGTPEVEGRIVSHTYTEKGIFIGTLIVEKQEICGINIDSIKFVMDVGFNVVLNDSTICEYESVTLDGGHDYELYEWSNGEIDKQFITINQEGHYNVSITDHYGCTATDPDGMYLTVKPAPVVSISKDTNICYGTSVMISSDSDNGNQYSWSPNYRISDINSQQPTVNPLKHTKYKIRVDNGFNCFATKSVQINVDSLPETPSVNGLTHFCSPIGSSEHFSSSKHADSLIWSFLPSNAGNIVNPYKDTITINWDDNFTGNAQLRVSAVNHCAANAYTQATVLNVFKTPSADHLVSQPVCFYDTISIDYTGDASAAASYGKIINSNIEIISETSQNTKLFCHSDTLRMSLFVNENNCYSDTLDIKIPIPDSIEMKKLEYLHITCHDANDGKIIVKAEGGTSNLHYSISEPIYQADTIFDNLHAGKYEFTIKDQNNCKIKTDSIEIINPDSIKIQVNKQEVLCYGGNNGSIDLTITGGWTVCNSDGCVYSKYNWSNGAITEDLSNLIAGNYSFTVIDMHDNTDACKKTIEVEITQPDSLLIKNVQIKHVSCYNDIDGEIDFITEGGSLPYNFVWSNTDTTAVLDSVKQGSYSLTITDKNNCKILKNFTITQPPPLNIKIDSIKNISCFGGTDGFIKLNNENFPYSYEWNNGEATKDIENLSAENYIVKISNYGIDCHIIDTTITQPERLSVEFSKLDTICVYDTLEINAEGIGGVKNYVYHWQNNTNALSPDTTTNYNFIITDANDCTRDTNYTVELYPKLNTEILSDKYDICPGEAFELSIKETTGGKNNNYAYIYENKIISLPITINDLQISSKFYIKTKHNECNDFDTDTVVIHVFYPPEIDRIYTIKDTIYEGEYLDIEAILLTNKDDINYYYWKVNNQIINENSDKIEVRPSEDAQYQLIVKDINNCKDTLRKSIVVIKSNALLYNLFTPNGDGYNDFWVIDNLKRHGKINVSIFNRLGNLIYSTNDYLNNPWYGNYKNKKAPTDTYYYIIEYNHVFKNNKKIVITGDLTLMR